MAQTTIVPLPEMFTGEDYDAWAVKMEYFLHAQKLWDLVINDPEVMPENPTIAQMKELADIEAKRYRALSVIVNNVSPKIFRKIIALKTPKEVWEALRRAYSGTEKRREQQAANLRRQFENLKMGEGEKVRDYADRISEIVNKMQMLGEDEISERRKVQKLTDTLPRLYEPKIGILEETKDMKTIEFEDVVNSLESVEQREENRQESTSEGAFRAKGKEKVRYSEKEMKKSDEKKTDDKKDKEKDSGNSSKKNFQKKKGAYNCRICRRKYHTENECWWRPDAQCSACNQKGHVEKVCKNKRQQIQAAKVADEATKEEQVLVATCLAGSSRNHRSEWLIDSGCTHHMVHDRSLFKSLDLNYSGRVRIGNGEYLKVKGKGSVTVRTPTGTKTINDVLYVPDIDVNLVSVGQLIEKKYRIEFKDNLCIIYEPAGIELFAVEMKNRSFSLEWLEPSVHAVNADMLNLWHQRLGHVSFQTLDKMQKAGLVENLPSFHVNNSICEVCQLGKQARSPFPSESTWRAKEKLQLLHADLGGPMRTQSVGGSRYYLLIIDDFSRFSWIYFLKEKSEAAENFMRFKIWVENQTECKIKAIRTDNGTEFVSKKFKEILSTAGIQHQLTVPYSPQQNGVVERKNRTVIEMTRCLLFEKQIPKKLWAEAANTAVYLMNRLPTKAVLKKTPYEAWFGSKPGVSHLKVFGSVCYYWIPEPKREKLDEKAEIGVLVGYSSESKGYRVFNPLLEKVVISRDVRVDESSLWN